MARCSQAVRRRCGACTIHSPKARAEERERGEVVVAIMQVDHGQARRASGQDRRDAHRSAGYGATYCAALADGNGRGACEAQPARPLLGGGDCRRAAATRNLVACLRCVLRGKHMHVHVVHNTWPPACGMDYGRTSDARTFCQNGGWHMHEAPYAAELGLRCSPMMSQHGALAPSCDGACVCWKEGRARQRNTPAVSPTQLGTIATASDAASSCRHYSASLQRDAW